MGFDFEMGRGFNGSLAFALDGVLVGAGRQRYLAGAMVAAGAAFALTTVAVGRRDLAAIWVRQRTMVRPS